MGGKVTLPHLLGFRLSGFQPMFNNNVAMDIRIGPNIILGGNGLGKTTIMQAVVYGLTGGSDGIGVEGEDEKALRWSHKYFRRRIDDEQLASALIEVDFAFGKHKVSVRRGFSQSGIVAFRHRHEVEWLEDADAAKIAFDSTLAQYGGYDKPEDFAFIVHRLLYLPETRRLIAWDSNAQVRLLMLLNQDVQLEDDFRQRREKLKNLDSTRRHLTVALNKVAARIDKLKAQKQQKRNNSSSRVSKTNEVDMGKLIEELQAVTRHRLQLERERRIAAEKLSTISSETEKLREQVEQSEAAIITALVSEQEKINSLAIHKLSENGICPVCGTWQRALQALAHQHSLEHRCMLCGSDEPQPTQPELTTLRSQIAEKIRSQQSLEDDFRVANNRLESVQRDESRLQYQLNVARMAAQPVLTLIERDLPPASKSDLLQTRLSLEQQEADLKAQVRERQNELEKDYQNFREAADARIARLRTTYAIYASEFLGIPCELMENPVSDHINFTRFIPKFDGKERDSPESCSEAQRFFLDIAFRMALIDLSSVANKSTASFICETPETALDASYIENVVKMFKQFADKGHSLLLTANIQSDSIASDLLALEPSKERQARVLNLLNIGRLSSVHQAALLKLRAIVRKILK